MPAYPAAMLGAASNMMSLKAPRVHQGSTGGLGGAMPPTGLVGKPVEPPMPPPTAGINAAGIRPRMGGAGGGADINSTLEALRGAVGYNPGPPPPLMDAGPEQAAGDPVGKPALGGPMPTLSPPQQMISGDVPPAVTGLYTPTGDTGPIPYQPGHDIGGQLTPAQSDWMNGGRAGSGGILAQPPNGIVGRGGNFQAFGKGRYGGNPPNALRRAGQFGGGGLQDRRQALNNRMRSRISSVYQSLNGGNFDPAQSYGAP